MRELIKKILNEESYRINEGLYEDGEGIYSVGSVGYYEPNSSYYFNNLKFIRKHNPDEESYITYGEGNNEIHSPIVTIIYNGISYDIPISDSKENIILDSYLKDGKLIAKIKKSNLLKFYPNFSIGTPKEEGINPKMIRYVLEKAFPENWHRGDSFFSPGVRGIYTIGDKLNSDESWSVMNFFDTKAEIHQMILNKYHSEKSKDPIESWLINKLRTDNQFVNELVDRQWQSIKSGIISEKLALDTFLKRVEGDSITYPPGARMDRYEGVDVTFNGHNLQIKPLKSFNKKTDSVNVTTYGMRDYQGKTKVNYIVFINNNDILVFKNSNYIVNSSTNVTFNSNPLPIDVLRK
jgi:hypothetical protein